MRLCDGIYGVLRGMQLFKLSKSNKYLPDTEQIIKSKEKKMFIHRFLIVAGEMKI